MSRPRGIRFFRHSLGTSGVLFDDSLVRKHHVRHGPADALVLTRWEAGCYGVARAEVAQLAEHSPEKAGVDSSILSLGTIPSIP